MPGPVFRGQVVREIKVPKRTVAECECERCGRTWLTHPETDTAKVIVKMTDSDGSTIVDTSYDVICDGCTKTVGNLLKALAREMKKKSPESEAKKEGANALSEHELGAMSPDASRERTSTSAVLPPFPSGPSKRS